MLKALCPFQPFSNCLCCVSPTLRCPLISSLRQDLSFSHLLTSFFECNLTPHRFLLPSFSLPVLLFLLYLLFFFPSLHFLCDGQCIKQERSAVSFFLFWRSPYKTWPLCCERLSSGTVHIMKPQVLKITRSAVLFLYFPCKRTLLAVPPHSALRISLSEVTKYSYKQLLLCQHDKFLYNYHQIKLS